MLLVDSLFVLRPEIKRRCDGEETDSDAAAMTGTAKSNRDNKLVAKKTKQQGDRASRNISLVKLFFFFLLFAAGG